MTILYTSLAEIKSFQPCSGGWKVILEAQGKTKADDVLFPLKDCLNSNSFADVCWLLGNRGTEIDIAVNAAKMCADSVAHVKNADAYVKNAAAYAAAAAYSAYAANAANAAAHAANAAADAANAAYAATAYAAYDAANAAYAAQVRKNRQFLLDAILQYENTH